MALHRVALSLCRLRQPSHHVVILASLASHASDSDKAEKSKRSMGVTPSGKLDAQSEGRHRDAEKQPLEKFPDNVNPASGEIGGPVGPEPTRYGDWERKGRVSDF